MWGGDTAHGQLCCVREAPTKQPAAGGNNIREWKRSDGRAQKSRRPTYQGVEGWGSKASVLAGPDARARA